MVHPSLEAWSLTTNHVISSFENTDMATLKKKRSKGKKCNSILSIPDQPDVLLQLYLSSSHRFYELWIYMLCAWTILFLIFIYEDSSNIYSIKVYIYIYILNKSWRQHPTRHQLYGHLPPITKTIQVRRTRHAGHCWRSKDELISDVLLWTPTYCQVKAGRPAWTYMHQLCEDMGCNPEDLPKAMNDKEKWQERVRDIRPSGTTWWYIYIYIYICYLYIFIYIYVISTYLHI